jgi:hypothetical protein
MCCRKDDKLTAQYRARKRPIRAWKVYWTDRAAALEAYHNDKAGGIVRGPGIVQSNTRSAKSVDRTKRGAGYVYKGIHSFLKRSVAETEAGRQHSTVAIVPVRIDPADVRAVGPQVFNNGLGDTCVGNEIVATKVRITPHAFRKATKPCQTDT